jgi:succinyl-diaminopimelate desuccinylase
MGSGYQGDGIKTIVPATSTAKLALRLVPNQVPGDITKKVGRRARPSPRRQTLAAP